MSLKAKQTGQGWEVDLYGAFPIMGDEDTKGNVTLSGPGAEAVARSARKSAAQHGSRILSKALTGSYLGGNARLITDVNTTHVETVLEAGFDQVRILIPNRSAAIVTYKASIATATALGANNSAATIDPTLNGGAWVDCTFANSTGAAPAFASSVENVIATNWMDLNSLDRADGGTLPVLHVRVEATAGTTVYTLTAALASLAGWEVEGSASVAPYGRPWRARTQAVAGVTTKGDFTSTTSASQHIPFIIQYLSRATGGSIYVNGDSRLDGFGATLTNNNATFRAACALSTPQFPIEVCNLASSGAAGITIYRRAIAKVDGGLELMTYLKPDALITLSDYVNDNAAAPLTAAEIVSMRGWLSRTLALADTTKAVRIVCTAHPTPTRVTNGTDDALRIAYSNEAKANALAAGYEVIDLRALLTAASLDGSGREVFATGLSDDALHCSEAGYTAEVPVFRAAISSALGL